MIKNHNPRMGTETISCNILHWSFPCTLKIIIPVRGRKQSWILSKTGFDFLLKIIIPVRGRKRSEFMAMRLFRIKIKNHNPRKGTETFNNG